MFLYSDHFTEVLQRYLEKNRVTKGKALETARVFLSLEKNRQSNTGMWEEPFKRAVGLVRALHHLVPVALAEELGPKFAQDNIDPDIVDYFHSLLREKFSQSPSNTTTPWTQPESGGGGQGSSTPTQETMVTKDVRSDTSNTVTPPSTPSDTMAVEYPGILVRGNKKPRPKSFPHELLQAFFTGENARRKLTYDEAVRIGIEGGHNADRVKWQLRHNLLKRDYIRFAEQAKRKGRERKSVGGARKVKVVIDGESSYWQVQSDAMATIFKELQKRDPNFCQSFYKHPRNHSGKRRIIAQDPRELYANSDDPKFKNAYRRLRGSWFISTSYSWKHKINIIAFAVGEAGLEFGKDIIINFDDSLQRQERQVPASLSSGASERKQSVHRRVGSASGRARSGRVKVVIAGKESSWQDQSEAMATVFRELQKRDRNFCQRFYDQPRNHGRTRRIIAQDARELYDNSDNPHLEKAYRQIDDGWFISTSHSWPRKKEIIQLAADVAGLKFKEDISGKDIIVNLWT